MKCQFWESGKVGGEGREIRRSRGLVWLAQDRGPQNTYGQVICIVEEHNSHKSKLCEFWNRVLGFQVVLDVSKVNGFYDFSTENTHYGRH